MDGKNRAASSYLSPGNPPADKEQNDPLAQVFHNACSYNFFAMAELLHRLAKGEKGTPELSLRDDPAQETLRFSADASLAFPCSDISALKRDTSGAFRMTTTFMGLQGSQSPLPGYYLDHLAWKAVHEQSPVPEVKRALHTVLSPRAVNLPLHLRDGTGADNAAGKPLAAAEE